MQGAEQEAAEAATRAEAGAPRSSQLQLSADEALVQHFLATLARDAPACAAPPVRLVPVFARRVAELEPLPAAPDDASSAEDRRLAAAALATVADMLARTASGRGLRGGRYRLRVHGAENEFVLESLRWCTDLAVSGRVMTDAQGSGGWARLRLLAADGRRGTLHVRWPPGGPEALATLTGTVNGHTLAASAPAP